MIRSQNHPKTSENDSPPCGSIRFLGISIIHPEAKDRANRNAKPGVHFYGVKLVPRFQWFQWFPSGFKKFFWKMFCYFQLIQWGDFFLSSKMFYSQRFVFCFPLKPWVRNLRSQNWLGHIFCGFVALFWGFLNRNPRDKVHISWPDADDLLSNGLEFDNEVEGPWPLGRRACLQVRLGIGWWRPSRKKMGGIFEGEGPYERKGWLFWVKCFFHWEMWCTKPCNQS